MNNYVRIALIGVALAGVASASNLLTNGSFELPTVTNGSYNTYNAGDSSSIPGWTVTGTGNVAIVIDTFSCCGGITYNASDGTQSIDLTGTSDNGNGGGVAQSLTGQTVGDIYTVSFDVGNYDDPNGAGSPGPTEISLFVDGALIDTYTNANNTAGQVNWQTFSYSFTNDADALSIEFRNAGGDGNYAGLDNVVLTDNGAATPEPGTWVMLFGGLALMAGWRVKTARG